MDSVCVVCICLNVNVRWNNDVKRRLGVVMFSHVDLCCGQTVDLSLMKDCAGQRSR